MSQDEFTDNTEQTEESGQAAEVEETEADSGEAEVEGKPSKEYRRVPVKELEAERARAREVERRLGELQGYTAALAQQLQGQQRQQTQPEASVDPELQKLLEPVLAPLKHELNSTRQQLSVYEQQVRADQNWNQITRLVPDIFDLKDDLMAELSEFTPQEAEAILWQPKMVKKICDVVRAKRPGSVAKAKQELKGRARSESGTAATPSGQTTQRDWSKMSHDSPEFEKALKELGWEI